MIGRFVIVSIFFSLLSTSKVFIFIKNTKKTIKIPIKTKLQVQMSGWDMINMCAKKVTKNHIMVYFWVYKRWET